MIGDVHKLEQLFKYCDRAQEAASMLTALSRMPMRDFYDYANQFQVTHIFKTIELMHEFSFLVRKSIELSSTINPKIMQQARVLKPARSAEKVKYQEDSDLPEQQVQLTDRDFYWIINKIIHSQKTFVVPLVVKTFSVSTEKKIEKIGFYKIFGHTFKPNKYTPQMAEKYYRLFVFQSDHDKPNEYHYVDICDMMEMFMDDLYAHILKATGRAEELGY